MVRSSEETKNKSGCVSALKYVIVHQGDMQSHQHVSAGQPPRAGGEYRQPACNTHVRFLKNSRVM